MGGGGECVQTEQNTTGQIPLLIGVDTCMFLHSGVYLIDVVILYVAKVGV